MNERALIIIGSGPAGYSAGVYAARANLAPLLFLGATPGGQLTTTTDVENWPGGKVGLLGPELMTNMHEHALHVGVECLGEHITEVNLGTRPFYLKSGDTEYYCKSLIIATGADALYLGLDSEQRFLGKGVSACATCDGFFYTKKIVAVVGGGNTAVEEALYLSKIAKKVFLIHRRDRLRCEAVLKDRLDQEIDKGVVEVLWNHRVEEVLGNEFVEGVSLAHTTSNDKKQLAIDGLFIAIGHSPNTALFQNQLAMERGYIIVGQENAAATQTSVPGVFAAGDVSDPLYRQAITSAGSGCMAALDANQYLHQ